jgi:hypothetical protein
MSSALSGIRELANNRPIRIAVTSLIAGEVGAWGGYAVSALAGVAIAPLMPLLGNQYLLRNILEYALEGRNIKAHKISLIKAGVEAITCTAVLLTCLAVGVLAPPVLGLVLGVSGTYILYNLYKAKVQHDEMMKKKACDLEFFRNDVL